MLYKEDWEKCKERFDAFWEGEILDRCLIAVTAPREKPVDPEKTFMEAGSLEEQWLSTEYRMNNFLFNCSKTFYGGEAFPSFWNNLGPGVMTSFIGGSYKLDKSTVWFDRDPIIHDWIVPPEIKFFEESPMWETLYSMTGSFSRNSYGDYIVGVSDIGGNYDIAAALRGTQELLFDLYDNPDSVRQLVEKIDNLWFDCFGRLNSLIRCHIEGASSWMPLWCRGSWYPLQCDFSAMLSPEMFEEFVIPALERETKFLDKSIYHWDGPGQIPHLDLLLELPYLTGIQWNPGYGNPDVTDEKWYPLYKRIQKKGKNLVLYSENPGGIEKLLENISPEGLYILTYSGSETDADELIKKVEKWSCRT